MLIPDQIEVLKEVARYSDDYAADVSDAAGAALDEIERLQQQRDVLLAACKAFLRCPPKLRHGLHLEEIVSAAIALAEQGATP